MAKPYLPHNVRWKVWQSVVGQGHPFTLAVIVADTELNKYSVLHNLKRMVSMRLLAASPNPAPRPRGGRRSSIYAKLGSNLVWSAVDIIAQSHDVLSSQTADPISSHYRNARALIDIMLFRDIREDEWVEEVERELGTAEQLENIYGATARVRLLFIIQRLRLRYLLEGDAALQDLSRIRYALYRTSSQLAHLIEEFLDEVGYQEKPQ